VQSKGEEVKKVFMRIQVYFSIGPVQNVHVLVLAFTVVNSVINMTINIYLLLCNQ
jgi:hypothetical protein